jgi:HAD superfamily hydrolase (TIGR01458 family)
MRRPALICLDIDGTLTTGVMEGPIAGAVDAIGRLRSEIPVRLVTNTTSRSHRTLFEHLRGLGFLQDPEELITPATSARRVLTGRDQAAGILLVEPAARDDFTWFREDPDGPVVLLGTEAHGLSILDLQPAFRALLHGAAFYTLQKNRYFRRGDALVTDLGPVVAFLSYASGCDAENVGKPSRLLFEAIAAEAGIGLGRMIMVGDDAEFDVAGARALGLGGVLVRTGKYRPGDESRHQHRPDTVLGSVKDLPRSLGIS